MTTDAGVRNSGARKKKCFFWRRLRWRSQQGRVVVGWKKITIEQSIRSIPMSFHFRRVADIPARPVTPGKPICCTYHPFTLKVSPPFGIFDGVENGSTHGRHSAQQTMPWARRMRNCLIQTL